MAWQNSQPMQHHRMLANFPGCRWVPFPHKCPAAEAAYAVDRLSPEQHARINEHKATLSQQWHDAHRGIAGGAWAQTLQQNQQLAKMKSRSRCCVLGHCLCRRDTKLHHGTVPGQTQSFLVQQRFAGDLCGWQNHSTVDCHGPSQRKCRSIIVLQLQRPCNMHFVDTRASAIRKALAPNFPVCGAMQRASPRGAPTVQTAA